MKSWKRMIFITIIIVFLVSILIAIECAVLINSNASRANKTAAILINQVENIISENERKEDALVASLKEDYITRAKAISYIMDHDPDLEDDIAEQMKIANFMSVDEIHLFDKTGTIYSGTTPQYYGFNFDSGEQMAYFKPMLSDRSLTMCQDVTPNTAEQKEMMYAICWNEDGTRMVQVGITPVRLLQELKSNEISEVVEGMPSYGGIEIIVANHETHEIEGATSAAFVGKKMDSIGFADVDQPFDEVYYRSMVIDGVPSYCAVHEDGEYIIAVVQDKNTVNQFVLINLLIVLLYLAIAVGIMIAVIMKLTKSILKEQKNANTDKLTGLLNRRGYENALLACPEIPAEKNFVYVSMDLNGLKGINDTFGHATGDDFIRGAVNCMKCCLGNYGELYRIGGDEFAAIIFADDDQLKKIKLDLQDATVKWSDEYGKELSIACGYVQKREYPEKTVVELAQIADARMYQDKELYYKKKGEERRKL